MARKIIPLADRFWVKVDKSGGPDACWTWMASTSRHGYGKISAGRRGQSPLTSSRVAWQLVNGLVQDGLYVCHSCDNPGCCNPKHMFLGTQQDNMTDASAKGRTAFGSRNGSHTRPDRRATGDRNWSKTKPWSVEKRSGNNHYTKTNPDAVAHGERHYMAKLSNDSVMSIRSKYKSGVFTMRELGKQYGVSVVTIHNAIHGRSWRRTGR